MAEDRRMKGQGAVGKTNCHKGDGRGRGRECRGWQQRGVQGQETVIRTTAETREWRVGREGSHSRCR